MRRPPSSCPPSCVTELSQLLLFEGLQPGAFEALFAERQRSLTYYRDVEAATSAVFVEAHATLRDMVARRRSKEEQRRAQGAGSAAAPTAKL